jgi:polar amino acid transport system substrate-binding protein
MTKHFLKFTLLAFLLFSGSCAKQAHNQLIVGMELAYPPFEMTDERGNPTGVSVDLARALGKQLGRDVEIRNVSFDGLIPSLQTGKIDVIISSMTATPERAKTIAFSDPYLRTGLCLLIGTNSPVQSIEDLDKSGRTVVVKKGTTGHVFATDKIKNAKLLVLDKEDACVLEIVQGKADAFLYDQISTFENWQRHKDTTRSNLKPFQEESWAIGLRQADTEVQQKVNQFLKDFKGQGGFDELGDRYLKVQKEAFKKLGYSFYF